MKKVHEHLHRSVIKAITFRILVIVVNTLFIYFYTQRLDFTVSVMATTSITSTILYILHERLWNEIHWGRHHR